MNNLTWFLYLTSFPDKIGNLTALAGLVSFFGFIAIVISLGMISNHPTDNEKFVAGNLLSIGRIPIVIWIIMLVVWFVIPPKETLYYMAASEIGEKVVTDPQAIEIMGDLKSIIKGYAQEFNKGDVKK